VFETEKKCLSIIATQTGGWKGKIYCAAVMLKFMH